MWDDFKHEDRGCDPHEHSQTQDRGEDLIEAIPRGPERQQLTVGGQTTEGNRRSR